jgi:2-methylcitrate dehydratase PrpD
VDLIQSLKQQHDFAPDDVTAVLVRTHSLAEPLFARKPHNRLSAMFSFPFVVSAALLNDRFEPAVLEPGTAGFAAANNFSERITMEISPDFDRRLPAARWAEVRIDLRDGTSLSRAQPNPLGDVDYFPLGTPEIAAKLGALIGRPDTESIQATVAQLQHSPDAKATLATLRAI